MGAGIGSARITPSPPLGAERVGVRWGEPRVRSGVATHLTLPALPRRAPPSPPASGRRGANRARGDGRFRAHDGWGHQITVKAPRLTSTVGPVMLITAPLPLE